MFSSKPMSMDQAIRTKRRWWMLSSCQISQYTLLSIPFHRASNCNRSPLQFEFRSCWYSNIVEIGHPLHSAYWILGGRLDLVISSWGRLGFSHNSHTGARRLDFGTTSIVPCDQTYFSKFHLHLWVDTGLCWELHEWWYYPLLWSGNQLPVHSMVPSVQLLQ